MSLKLQAGVLRPPAGLIERFRDQMQRVASVWLHIARVAPVEITSWYRPSDRNLSVGGKAYSQHLVGTAIDGKVLGYTREQLLPAVQRLAAQYGVTAPSQGSEGSGTSVHVQGLPTGYLQTLLQREPTLVAAAQTFVGPPRPIA